jgi:hypothetical protein
MSCAGPAARDAAGDRIVITAPLHVDAQRGAEFALRGAHSDARILFFAGLADLDSARLIVPDILPNEVWLVPAHGGATNLSRAWWPSPAASVERWESCLRRASPPPSVPPFSQEPMTK